MHTDTRLYRLYTGTNKDAIISVAMTMYETDDQRFILRGTSERLDKVQQMTQLTESTSSGQEIPEVSRERDLLHGKTAFVPEEQWREVLPHHVCPPGLEFRMDFASGKNYARARLQKS